MDNLNIGNNELTVVNVTDLMLNGPAVCYSWSLFKQCTMKVLF
jgi:hypothetical protein